MDRIIVTHVASSSREGKQDQVDGKRMTLGRRPDNNVVFDPERDRAVSGHHAEVLVVDGGIHVKDLGSQNGTYLNGQRISGEVAVKDSDVIRFGEKGPQMRFAIAVGNDSATQATAVPPAKSNKTPKTEPDLAPIKQGIGQATLQKAIGAAEARERSRTRGLVLVTAIFLVVSGGVLGGWAWSVQQQHNQESSDAVEQARQDAEQAKRLASDISRKSDAALEAKMASYEKDLAEVQKKVGSGEAKVARLMIEIEERDKAMEDIRQRQDLSETERAKLLAETQKKLDGLTKDLKNNEDQLRKMGNVQDWSQWVSKYQNCMFLLAVRWRYPNGTSTGIGTGFSVRADGVIATNAHVAKMFTDVPEGASVEWMLAIQNGTGKQFEVNPRVLIHPDYKGVDSPDVALVKIDVKNLPVMPLATDDELRALSTGCNLATLGYPGELQSQYLSIVTSKGEVTTALATFKDGWVGKITDFSGQKAPFERSFSIQHSCSTSGGCSGSPMFTRDGKVVALNNAGLDYFVKVKNGDTEDVKRMSSPSNLLWAVRSDLLRNLMKSCPW